MPIYNHFVETAFVINPKYVSMIIPARWMASGLGLNQFRQNMLSDKRLRMLFDYPASNDVFPNVEIKGGVCYFMWDEFYNGNCNVSTIRNSEVKDSEKRDLSEFDVFVRDSRSLGILHKILAKKENSIIEMLAVDKEFGWTSNFSGFHNEQKDGDIPI